MTDSYPKYFYKYRSISNLNDLENDYSLEALKNNFFIFSSRLNFNDLFDSKIELVKPSAKDFKEIIKLTGKSGRKNLGAYIERGKLSPHGEDFIEDFEKKFNALIDSYAFLSLSSNPASNLMWSHYADSHKGFCIEYKSEFVKADKVYYREEIPSLYIYDVIMQNFLPQSSDELGKYIWTALRTKLKEWEYESEYRYKSNQFMGNLKLGQKFMKVYYESKFVESVIIGCRTPSSVKNYIIENISSNIKIKQAYVGKNKIEIKPIE